MSSTEPLRRHSSTAHPSVNRVDAPKHIVPKEPHKAQPVKEAADSSGKRRLINIYKLYIHFEPKKNSVYLGKVQVKRQNHLDNDLVCLQHYKFYFVFDNLRYIHFDYTRNFPGTISDSQT